MKAFLRQNAIGLIALFVALGGTSAYVANTVFSSDIVDGEVKTADLGTNAVTSSKITDGQVLWQDIATDAITSSRIKDASVLTQDLVPDAVTGSKIDESTLAQVPDAAKLAGYDASRYRQFSTSASVAASDCVIQVQVWTGCAVIPISVPSGKTNAITVSSTLNAISSSTQTVGFCAAQAGPQCLDFSGTPELLTLWGGAYTMGTSAYTWYIGGPQTFNAQTAVKLAVALSPSPNGKMTTRVDAYDASQELGH
jgi:hypothetical protein